jgi:hypothetical protein
MRVYNKKYSNKYVDIRGILQGDLVYIIHPNEERHGWYQKLRNTESKKVGYIQITGVAIGTWIKASSLEKPDYKYGIMSRQIYSVCGATNVAKFIGSDFTDESVVNKYKNDEILKKIDELEEENERIKSEIYRLKRKLCEIN